MNKYEKMIDEVVSTSMELAYKRDDYGFDSEEYKRWESILDKVTEELLDEISVLKKGEQTT